jgi:TolA-binding protein
MINTSPSDTVNTLPADIFPIFQMEEEPVEEHEANSFQLTEEQLRLLQQDKEVLRETEEREAQEKAAPKEQEEREAEYRMNNFFDILTTRVIT